MWHPKWHGIYIYTPKCVCIILILNRDSFKKRKMLELQIFLRIAIVVSSY